MPITITEFHDAAHRAQVITLWTRIFGYETSHNIPSLVIEKKLALDDGLFFVALCDNEVVGTVMAGYDGHRGWIYSMAVTPELRLQGVGSALLQQAERTLAARGCLKINLQIMAGNDAVVKFYETNGFKVEDRISMGKRLEENIP